MGEERKGGEWKRSEGWEGNGVEEKEGEGKGVDGKRG